MSHVYYVELFSGSCFFFLDLGNETIRNLPEYFGLVALLQVGEFHYGRRL